MSEDITTEVPTAAPTAAESFITIRFCTAPGALSSFVLSTGANVNDAIAAASVDSDRVKSILVNNTVGTGNQILSDQDTVVVALHGAKGN